MPGEDPNSTDGTRESAGPDPFATGDDTPTAAETGKTGGHTRTSEAGLSAAGSRIGHFTIRQVLGEGGFGVVYQAEQTEPVRRTVAVKVIKLGLDTREVVQRFEAGKRLYDHYRAPACTGIVDSGYDDVDRYLRLGEILLAELEGPRRLIATNGILKLGDLLCSRAAELDPASAARARALLLAERTLVDALAERGS